MGLESAYALASEVISCNAASEEGREGLDAFLEKGKTYPIYRLTGDVKAPSRLKR